MCLSHDPALIISDDDRHEPFVPTREEACLAGHKECDIMIGAFSYPLVRIGCYGLSLTGPTGCKGVHSQVIWIEIDWLRLLCASHGVLDTKLTNPLTRSCWTPERLIRLAREMGA